ncbi:MAG: Butyrate kinase [Ignavibacteriae bacterium]|nr:MAG: Butyrate kinase [Ignavibacteriota bacterium]
METFKILVVNPGSTSTKIALFFDEQPQITETLKHSTEELKNHERIWEQFDFRYKTILDWIRKNQLNHFDAVVTLGGLFRAVEGGTYEVNEKMLKDAKANLQGEHASNLGCALAHKLAEEFQAKAFVVDPVSVDEFESLARYSGHPKIERRSLSHALSLHEAARNAADKLSLDYYNSSFVVAHMGGGISVAPIKNGNIIDVNDASSDGPFSPERTGGLPLQPFITIAFSGEYTEQQLRKFVMGNGGLVAYLGTNSAEEVENKIRNGDNKALEVFQAMAYQIAKEIGAMSTVLYGKIDAIVLTGGLAKSEMLTGWIKERINFIAPVLIFPGDDEMKALAKGALRVLKKIEKAKIY